MQTLLALGALAMVMLFSLNMYRTTAATQQRLALGEIASQLSSVGGEVLDYLETKEFDAKADTSLYGPMPVQSATEFTPEDNFGVAVTCSYRDCKYLEEYDTTDGGRTPYTLNRQGFDFEVDIDVSYVNPLTLAPSASRTTAKEVVLTITNPSMRQTDNTPFEFKMSRVYTYERSFRPVGFTLPPPPQP